MYRCVSELRFTTGFISVERDLLNQSPYLLVLNFIPISSDFQQFLY